MTAQIEGVDEVLRNMQALADRYGKAAADAAQAGGQLVRSEAIKSIQTKSGGRTVTRSREGGGTYQHTASAAGQAPNTDTGRLVQSVQVEARADDVYVGSTLSYARDLEFGTRYMLPRPWLNPALEARRREIERLFAQGVDSVTQRYGDV